MSAPFVAEIRLFACNFAPTGWAFCHGQLLPISQNTALFSLLGTYYGGDGKSTFALPDLQGRVPMHTSDGGGAVSQRFHGETGGAETVTLLQSEIPFHTHALRAVAAPATYNRPTDTRVLAASVGGTAYAPPQSGAGSAAPSQGLADPNMLAHAGSSIPHNNMQPYLALNYAIALQGVFPPRQ